MKKVSPKFLFIAALLAMLISACSGGASPLVNDLVGSGKGLAAPVELTGVISSINGNQWTINGQTITVDPALVTNGTFQVGDTIKVEVQVQADGSVVATTVQTPDSAPAASASQPAVVVSETPDAPDMESSLSASETPDPSKTPDPASSGTPDPNKSKEVFGTVDSITTDTIVVGGQTYQIATNSEIKNLNQIQAGTNVKLEFILNADGTMTIKELEIANPEQTGSSLEGNADSGSNSTGTSINNGNHDNSPDTSISTSKDSPDTSSTNSQDNSPDNQSSSSSNSPDSQDDSGSGS